VRKGKGGGRVAPWLLGAMDAPGARREGCREALDIGDVRVCVCVFCGGK